jgi:perosamine synthetase
VASSPSSSVATIPLFRVNMPPEQALLPALREVLYSGQVGEGPRVAAFEERFAARVGARHARAVSSGTAALHLALLLAGVGSGDEVVSTPATAEPTNLAILHAGARPVWADVDPANGNVTAASVEAALTPRTRAIVVVHYGGVPVPLAGIGAVAAAHGLPVIEDAAHALGARYAGRPIGAHSRFVMFSLQAIKHMTTGDGGMLACREAADAEGARLLRWFGIDRQAPRTEADIARAGFKYNMTDITATLGLVGLEHIDATLARHVANGRHLDAALADLDGLAPATFEPAAEPAYWFHTVLADRRDDLIAHLAARGIAAGTVHRRNDAHSVFAASRRSLPGVDAFSARVVHLPCGWWVGEEERERIVDAVREGW